MRGNCERYWKRWCGKRLGTIGVEEGKTVRGPCDV